MRVIQVLNDYVDANVSNADAIKSVYRLTICDDSHGSTGKHHFSLRAKPVINMSVGEIVDGYDDKNIAYIKIVED